MSGLPLPDLKSLEAVDRSEVPSALHKAPLPATTATPDLRSSATAAPAWRWHTPWCGESAWDHFESPSYVMTCRTTYVWNIGKQKHPGRPGQWDIYPTYHGKSSVHCEELILTCQVQTTIHTTNGSNACSANAAMATSKLIGIIAYLKMLDLGQT